MDSEEQARRDAEQAAADERLGKIAERLGATASAHAVFGDPVERDGITVIPVARVRYGFGGGSGRGGRGRKDDGSEGEDQYGSGAGGGVQAAPLGYIELRDGRAEFKRAGGPGRMIATIAVPLVVLGAVALAVLIGGGRVFGRD